ncbi:MAG: tRNA 2-thiouridine(34) synthase MnmA [Ruminococcus sp.]|uniref:tRNA 2-thiouridine(34) synthase MnmA n=1 Tax=Ruminococcus sp. TaxID=41978 RepID=UPI0025EEE3E3|nr:tRNA 2-thiouridine(34) synthase MnmA [Ruminococcus sp.]MBR5682356.1 tRNA 2-thiouridine(34) synthase MnmA [Ruminococcus sp.]
MKKVMVGMSGGVDSSVAAMLLRRSGYEVMGVTLKLFSDEDISEAQKEGRTCCALSDVEDARSVAYRLGFEHIVFNFRDNFREHVMKQFADSYLCGRTPNPCIECNRHVKFDKMLRRAQELGYDYIATGHYAVVEYDGKSGRYLLKRSKDRSKDQTYVLYSLTQEQLAHTLFPLGGLEKTQVRELAEEAGLVNSNKPDSQDICFVPDGDYAAFIRRFTGCDTLCGKFVDMDGNVLGEHKGIINYTIGQRKGLGIALGHPAYVVKKDTEANTVTIGNEADLYTKSLIADDFNLISVEKLEEPMGVTAKTRYSQKEQPAVVSYIGNGEYRVEFDEPQRAVTCGQAVVLYDGDVVVGGGTIK